MQGESGEQVGDELESVTSSAGWFMQGWRNETGSWFQRWGVMHYSNTSRTSLNKQRNSVCTRCVIS